MKKLTKSLVALLVLLMMVLPMCVPTSAAAEGTMVSNAVNIVFGQQYFKYWTSDTDHLNHYSKFTISSKGIVTITATKPFDSEGEYGGIEFAIYNMNYELVYANESAYACDDPKSYYEINVGLAPGQYYFTMKPDFYVTSGLIETYYAVTFNTTNSCEQEPNGSGPRATQLNYGFFYTGYMNSDGAYEAEEYDYYKFNVTAGHKYRVYVRNFEKIKSMLVDVYLLLPGESDDIWVSYYMDKKVDASGYNYYEAEVKQSGTAYIYVEEGFDRQQFEYGIAVTDLALANVTGWVQEGYYWAYYQNGMKLTNQWKKDSAGWCYLNADGYMATNKWVKDTYGWCYVGSNGYMVYNKWVNDNGSWYYLDTNGRMVANKWVKDSGGWCYLDASGKMVTSKWVKDTVGWCYLDANGYMVTNKWLEDKGSWYYVGNNGYMITNKWVKDTVGWVYLDASGKMVTNKWVEDSVGWCFVGANGYAVTNCWKQDSIGWCYLGKNGSMLKYTWLDVNGKTYFLNENGYMVTGTAVINGTVYTFNASGELVK